MGISNESANATAKPTAKTSGTLGLLGFIGTAAGATIW
jgi:hypothetical protein